MLDHRLDPAPFGRRPGAGRPRLPRAPVLPSAPALMLVAPPAELVVVLLDQRVIADVLLPELAELHLGPEPRETDVWVIDHSRRRADPVFATAPLPRRATSPDGGLARRPLLGLRSFPELRAQGFQRFFDDPDARRQLDGAHRGGPPRAFGVGHFESGPWGLLVGRGEGSLDAAVARLRRRNLAIGLAVVTLLGGTAALLLLSARQVQRLARREMELVAGITHELRTPLAAIGSAADNLADGLVSEPQQIRRYGSLIRGETHRLGGLVAQVLEFAGAATARRRAPSPQPVEVGAVVDRVLEDLRFLIEEKGFTVERDDGAALPPALAEPEALRRALDNVIGNAIKYGETGRWVRIECGLAPGAERRIAIRVRDRGPGIPRAERRRIFEPFYRGDAAGRHLHGTGLGLAVTRSMLETFGASIEVEESGPGTGTTFLITVPAKPS
jgi:signal transduction histidine kinase